MAAMFVLGLVALAVFFVGSYVVVRIRGARRGFDAFVSGSTSSYQFGDDAFHASEMISIGSRLVDRPLPELTVDRSAFRITLQAAGVPEVLGIWRSDVVCMYTRRGLNGVGFSFKDRTHKADGLTIWCGSREPLRSTLAELGWLTRTGEDSHP